MSKTVFIVDFYLKLPYFLLNRYMFYLILLIPLFLILGFYAIVILFGLFGTLVALLRPKSVKQNNDNEDQADE